MNYERVINKKTNLSLELTAKKEDSLYTYTIGDFYVIDETATVGFLTGLLLKLKGDSLITSFCIVSVEAAGPIAKLLDEVMISYESIILDGKSGGLTAIISIFSDDSKLKDYLKVAWSKEYSVDALFFVLTLDQLSEVKDVMLKTYKTHLGKLQEKFLTPYGFNDLELEKSLLSRVSVANHIVLSRGHDGNWINIVTKAVEHGTMVEVITKA